MMPRKDRIVEHSDRPQPLRCNNAGLNLSGKLLLALAAVVLVAGVAFNWSWLVAAGVVPLLLGILPCAVMCGVGLCLMKKGTFESETTIMKPGAKHDEKSD